MRSIQKWLEGIKPNTGSWFDYEVVKNRLPEMQPAEYEQCIKQIVDYIGV